MALPGVAYGGIAARLAEIGTSPVALWFLVSRLARQQRVAYLELQRSSIRFDPFQRRAIGLESELVRWSSPQASRSSAARDRACGGQRGVRRSRRTGWIPAVPSLIGFSVEACATQNGVIR